MLQTMPKGRVAKRIGGRGCPSCGSHDTEGLGKTGAQWCISCSHRWIPCSYHCRGYRLDVDSNPEHPCIKGCPDCGVPDRIAWKWPEAWRAMALQLDSNKLKPIV